MLTREGDAEVHRHIQCRGSGPGVQPDVRVCIPQGKRQLQCRPVHRGRPAHTQRMLQLPEVHRRTIRLTERSPRAQNPDAESRGTRNNAVPLRHVEPARVPLRHATPSHHRFLTRCICWRKHNRADYPILYLDTLIKTGSESIEATLRRRRVLVAGFVARMEDTRMPNCVMSEKWWGAGCVWGQEKKCMGRFLDDLKAFGINADQWTTAAQDEGEWRRTVELGA